MDIRIFCEQYWRSWTKHTITELVTHQKKVAVGMAKIFIHSTVRDILVCLDFSVASIILGNAHLFAEESLAIALSTPEIEIYAVYFKSKLFRKQCLHIFLTRVKVSSVFIFYAVVEACEGFEISNDVIDLAQNQLQEMHDGINTFRFEK